MAQPSSTVVPFFSTQTGRACTRVKTVPWCKLATSGVFCANAFELAEDLKVSMDVVLESIEALTLVQADALLEMFRLRELASA